MDYFFPLGIVIGSILKILVSELRKAFNSQKYNNEGSIKNPEIGTVQQRLEHINTECKNCNISFNSNQENLKMKKQIMEVINRRNLFEKLHIIIYILIELIGIYNLYEMLTFTSKNNIQRKNRTIFKKL